MLSLSLGEIEARDNLSLTYKSQASSDSIGFYIAG
jgi:hypothetical protein